MSRWATDEDVAESDEYTPGSAADEPTEDAETQPSEDIKKARRVIRGGWGNAKRVKETASPFPVRLSPDKDGVVVKFLEDGPYVNYKQHWINEIKEGSKAFTCREDIDDEGCPLCDGGNRPSPQFHFNVAELSADGSFVHKTYNVGPTVFDQLSDLHSDPRQGPLEKYYWVIKRSKNGNKWTTTLFRQRKEDREDEGCARPDPAELEKVKLWDEGTVRWTSRKDLLEIAAQYLNLE